MYTHTHTRKKYGRIPEYPSHANVGFSQGDRIRGRRKTNDSFFIYFCIIVWMFTININLEFKNHILKVAADPLILLLLYFIYLFTKYLLCLCWKLKLCNCFKKIFQNNPNQQVKTVSCLGCILQQWNHIIAVLFNS